MRTSLHQREPGEVPRGGTRSIYTEAGQRDTVYGLDTTRREGILERRDSAGARGGQRCEAEMSPAPMSRTEPARERLRSRLHKHVFRTHCSC